MVDNEEAFVKALALSFGTPLYSPSTFGECIRKAGLGRGVSGKVKGPRFCAAPFSYPSKTTERPGYSCLSSMAAWAAASRATGTRKGLQLT